MVVFSYIWRGIIALLFHVWLLMSGVLREAEGEINVS